MTLKGPEIVEEWTASPVNLFHPQGRRRMNEEHHAGEGISPTKLSAYSVNRRVSRLFMRGKAQSPCIRGLKVIREQ